MTRTTAPATARRLLPDAPLLAAARGERPNRLPVWFMRQAGRSLPEYRQLRAGLPMLQACMTPELVCEITLQSVRRHGVDAAILFSDIMVPLHAAGIGLDIVPGTGPVVDSPVRSASDVAALPALEPEAVEPVAAAVRLLVAELGQVPLIGFAGAPFTLASYLVEGGPSRHHEHTKALMHSQPDVWHGLLDRLAELTLTFLRVQAAAGVDVVGVDWRIPLDAAAQRVRAAQTHGPIVLQGNLDPAVLLAGWPAVEREAQRVIAQGRAADAHVLNLGHGVLPGTDPDMLTRIVELAHSR